MPEYVCHRCGYRFERTRLPYSCPYCGNTGTMSLVPTASDLVEEATPKQEKREEKEEQS